MLLATFRLEPDALAETFEQVADLKVEAERIAAHATEWTMPCVWMANTDFEAVDDALTADPSVDAIVEAVEFANEKYYQFEWSDEVEDRIDSYIDHAGSMLYAEATTDGWRVRIRFATRDQFDAFRETLHERGKSFELAGLTQPEDPRHMGDQLTSAQREALRAAEEHGYYAVPREISARELAAELDMSHKNLSELLRRGTSQLIDETLRTAANLGEQ